MSKAPDSGSRKRIRLSEARLQAVSSRNIYSEQGFEARIGPSLGQVCHSLIVSWNWKPGSAQAQAERAAMSKRRSALIVLAAFPVERSINSQSLCLSAASMKALLTLRLL